ncbi:MAG: hypothetical protein H7210_07965 [Pyrinomonadaceae bacterium]|nr:hypothetical protein [Phycisphaerales bacterium]
MRTRLLWLSLISGLCAQLAACKSLNPPYKTAALEFDEAWLGTWEVVPDEIDPKEDRRPERFTVTARDVDTSGERIGLGNSLLGGGTPKTTTKQFTIRAEVGQDAGELKDLSFDAFLVKTGSSHLVGLQLAALNINGKQQAIAGIAPLMLPVHFVFKIERRGDELLLWSPESSVVWIPWVTPLDESGASRYRNPNEDQHNSASDGFFQASSIDRLLDHYASIIDKPESWIGRDGNRPTAKRIAPSAPPPDVVPAGVRP